ncbi:Fur family transcriptional regulator [Paraherbaspirillum soli]|uniref:Fur family transcriptional regulator n=1 Tax=Paraherbaspirillum soli TaxID=631222 RepID=A0ABW0M2L0_9BURK
MNPGSKSKSGSAPLPTAAEATTSRHPTTLAETQLREMSVRTTPARVKVLAALLDARCAFSHQDMQDLFVEMDRVTLYRALDCLTDAGLAHKIAGDDRVFRYSAGAEHTESATRAHHPQHQHGHFKCTRCAKVFCLDGSGDAGFLDNVLTPTKASGGASAVALRQQLQQALQDTLGQGFQGHDIELTIKGWCADCVH